jgi:hypothetical protein
MKNFIVAAALFNLFTTAVFAQKTQGTKPLVDIPAEEDTDTETVFAIDEGVFSGYGGGYWGTSLIDGHWVPTYGVRGGWIANSRLIIGVDLSGLSSRFHPDINGETSPVPLNISRWGAMFEYVGSVRRRVHGVYTLVVGRGKGGFDLSLEDVDAYPTLRESSFFWFIAPEAQLEVNLTKYTKPYVGLRAVIPFAVKGNAEIESKFLTEAAIFIGVKVGQFTY